MAELSPKHCRRPTEKGMNSGGSLIFSLVDDKNRSGRNISG